MVGPLCQHARQRELRRLIAASDGRKRHAPGGLGRSAALPSGECTRLLVRNVHLAALRALGWRAAGGAGAGFDRGGVGVVFGAAGLVPGAAGLEMNVAVTAWS